MSVGPRLLINEPCGCGAEFVWTKHGVFNERWRLECICGRCGPWRRHPRTEIAGARSPSGVSPLNMPLSAPPPPPKK